MKLFTLTLLILTIGVFLSFFTGVKESFSNADLSTLPVSDTPVVIELFTSQGCSSCPPADRVLEALTQRENLYILSCHVTYWDYIGWKDTLGSPACDQRQRQYAYSLNKRPNVYTPQIIINGKHDLVGSRSGQVISTIKVAQSNKIAHINLTFDDNILALALPKLDNAGAVRLKAFLIKKEEVTPIGRGENRNRTVKYVQNVKHIYTIGNWNGEQNVRPVPLPPHLIRTSDADEVIVVASDTESEHTVAVGRIKL